REDHRELTKNLVASDMVAVMVRVDEELDRLFAHLLDLGDDARSDVLELRIDHEHRVGSDEETDVASAAVERVHASRQWLDAKDVLGLPIVVLRGDWSFRRLGRRLSEERGRDRDEDRENKRFGESDSESHRSPLFRADSIASSPTCVRFTPKLKS